MANQTRSEATPDLDELQGLEDPDGKKTYLTVLIDLTDDDWMQTLKGRSESTRTALSPDEAKSGEYHHAFDTAFIAAERLAQRDAKAGIIVVSAVHDVEVAHPLDQKVETEVVLDVRPRVP